MSREELSGALVLVAVALAVMALVRLRRRPHAGRSTPRQPLPAAGDAPAAAQTTGSATEGVSAPPPATPRKLTPREQRREEIEARTQKPDASCLYCQADAEHPFPYAAFTGPLSDVGALFTGDLPRQWRVRCPDAVDAAPLLCNAHHSAARSAVELYCAQMHAAHAEFVASQKDKFNEFAAFGLDEAMGADALRVRKGTPKGGA